MGVKAVRTLDCAAKVRIHYILPCPIERQWVTIFSGATVEIHEFSKITKGAQDMFAMKFAQNYRAAGVLGERKITVTFGKLGERRVWEGLIDDFEQRLESALAEPTLSPPLETAG